MNRFLKLATLFIAVASTISCQNSIATSSIEQASSSSTDVTQIKKIITDDFTMYQTPSGAVVYSFAFDSTGALWIGLTEEIIKWAPFDNSYAVFKFESPFEARELLIDKSDNVWVGNISGLQIFQNNQWYQQDYGTPMFSTSTDVLWGSSYDVKEGACVHSHKKLTWEEFCLPNGESSRAFDIAVGPNGLLWVSLSKDDFSSSKGVWRLKDANWEQIYELSNDTWPIYHLAEDSTGIIWAVGSKNVNTNELGVVKKFDGKQWFTTNSTEFIFDIKISPDNTLWAQGLGYLLRFNGSGWDQIRIDDQLYNSFQQEFDLFSFGFGSSGIICIGTDKGVICENSVNKFSNP